MMRFKLSGTVFSAPNRRRRACRVVLVGAEARLALWRKQPDHGEGHVHHANLLADHRPVAEQLARGGGAEDDHLCRGSLLGLGEVAAFGQRPVAHFEEIVADAVDRRRPIGVADHDRRRAADDACDGGDAGDLVADHGEVGFGKGKRGAFAGAPSA